MGPVRGFEGRPTDVRRSLFDALGCVAAFPSRHDPVLDMSPLHSSRFSPTVGVTGAQYVWRLTGFAADPVAKVGVIAMDGSLIGITPVQDNVYINGAVPHERAKELVAFDRKGKRVWSECVAFPAKVCKQR
jgi:hypothetical protein